MYVYAYIPNISLAITIHHHCHPFTLFPLTLHALSLWYTLAKCQAARGHPPVLFPLIDSARSFDLLRSLFIKLQLEATGTVGIGTAAAAAAQGDEKKATVGDAAATREKALEEEAARETEKAMEAAVEDQRARESAAEDKKALHASVQRVAELEVRAEHMLRLE